ncbi:uncharacterized protein J3R85_011155 [Psidium guajava]|nr:uncharacterized protein J3R85_011155 [Psidium guajava]
MTVLSNRTRSNRRSVTGPTGTPQNCPGSDPSRPALHFLSPSLCPRASDPFPILERTCSDNSPMNMLASTSICACHLSPKVGPSGSLLRNGFPNPPRVRSRSFKIVASSGNELDTRAVAERGGEEKQEAAQPDEPDRPSTSTSASNAALEKDLKKVVQKTASTFAPRASTATKNPAVPGTALYTVFEVQGYASLLLGGALSFNLLFPSNEPDIWRLMGMWSIWMFTIPSLRARDCSKNEKEALNYLFLLIPLLNVIIPFFWKSFAVVWSADTAVFFAMYAWKVRPCILDVPF